MGDRAVLKLHQNVANFKAGERQQEPGRAITNGRESKSISCLGRVFNFKLGCIATPGSKCMVCMQPLLKLKTRPKACPIS